MSWSPDTAFVQDYKNQLDVAFQQMSSRLRSTVEVVTQNAEYGYYERLGEATANEITTRHAATPLDDIDHTRRRVQIRGYNNALLFDNQDRLRMLIDPKMKYAEAQAAALSRKMDSIIISAASGTAVTGKTGSGTQSFDSANQIAVSYVESGAATNSGLTVAKLRKAGYLLRSNEVLQNGQKPHCIVSAKQIQDLLTDPQVTSSDYNTVRALVNGEIDTYMGFKFIQTELLTLNSSTDVRTCLVYVPAAMKFAIAEDINLSIDKRADKNNSWQVYSEATFGAVRMWEEAIVEIACDESP
jgi:hypothetical protein